MATGCGLPCPARGRGVALSSDIGVVLPTTVSLPASVGDAAARGALRFSGGVIACSLLAQRFGVTSSGSYLDAVTPLGLALAGIFLVSGTLVLHRRRLALFALMCALALLSAAFRTVVRSEMGGEASLTSLAQFLALASFATLTFAVPVEERAFFRVVNRWFLVVAIAGVAEFFLQFAGLPMFVFAGTVPNALLVEPFYNVAIPILQTGYFKSNGFFLLEPSLLSQNMAIALLIEILVLRRPLHLCLFSAALVLSVSGTGWLMIIGFVLTVVLSLGARGVVIAAATVAIGGLALAGLALGSPDIYEFLLSRTNEFQSPGSSAHLRFITPWWFASDVMRDSPATMLFGIGASLSEHPGRPPVYDYTVNSVVKLLVEFGLPTLLVFLALFFVGRRTRTQTALVAPALVWLLPDGGNIQEAFVLFPVLLLIVVANLRQDPDRGIGHEPAGARATPG